MIAQFGLTLLFLVTGSAKLFALASFRETLNNFGIPTILQIPVSYFLPVGELVLAITLQINALAQWSAVGMLLLLSMFSLAIFWQLSNGKNPQCNCFGQLRPTAISWLTLVRNGAFIAATSLVLWVNPSPLNLAMALDQARLLTIALLILTSQTGLIVFLLLQQHKLNQRINALESRPFASVKGLPAGSQAPNFNALNLQGETIAFWSLLEAKKMIVLVFFDANCQPCLTVVDSVRKWQEAYAKNLNFVLLGRGINTQSNLENYTGLTVLRQNDREISNQFQVSSIPSAVSIDDLGVIRSHLVIGAEAIEKLINSVL
ncbi:MAG: MauE/DoxX family redox-associated membrane protein [Methylococcales bacterium]